MKIRFLGTSHGLAEKGRFWQSVMIETSNGDYIFDAGAPLAELLSQQKYSFTRVREVFISHVHLDHISGLPGLVNIAHWTYPLMRFGVYLPEKERGLDQLVPYCSMLQFGKSFEDRVTFHLFDEGCFFNDGFMKVTAVHTNHLKATTDKAYGFLVEAEGKRVYITGDMHASLEDFPEKLLSEHVDAIITECSHFSAEKLLGKLRATEADKVYFIHIYPTSKYEDMPPMCREAGINAVFPNENDVFEV